MAANGAAPRQKRRKWDVEEPQASQPVDVARSIQESAAAAARIIAQQALNRLGPSNPAPSAGTPAPGPEASAAHPSASFTDISINASEPHHRAHLSKRSTLDSIEQRWGVSVVAKGRYYPPGVVPPTGSDPPIFLRIAPGTELAKKDVASRLSACAAAAADIEALLRGKPLPGAPPTLPHSSQPHVSTAPLPAQDASPYPVSGPGFHCLYLGIPASCPASWDLAGRVRGPDNAYLGHIAGACACVAALRGAGSATVPETREPLHVFLAAGDGAALEKARGLTTSLIDTVRADFVTAFPGLPRPPGPGSYLPPLPPPPAPMPVSVPTRVVGGPPRPQQGHHRAVPPPPYGTVPPPQYAAVPPPPYGTGPPPQYDAVPPPQYAAVPPPQYAAVPPPQYAAVPPPQYAAVPPPQYAAVPPPQYAAVPPPQYAAVPPPHHAAGPPAGANLPRSHQQTSQCAPAHPPVACTAPSAVRDTHLDTGHIAAPAARKRRFSEAPAPDSRAPQVPSAPTYYATASASHPAALPEKAANEGTAAGMAGTVVRRGNCVML
ncbi:hypothetical protein ACKKBG_A37340 [Auxenochlorella protothecoides x Auxenochlorella symbiontica]